MMDFSKVEMKRLKKTDYDQSAGTTQGTKYSQETRAHRTVETTEINGPMR